MIQAYADGRLVYDSRLEELGLLALTATVDLSASGVASLTLPPGHPAYGYFTGYRTVVTIYQNGVLLFRGRALYPTDDFYGRRTITCEGERGFFHDAVLRPYVYQDGPAAIFADIIGLYNAQVDDFKRFKLGTVTVTDPNNYIRLESTAAESVFDALAKMVERVGGYITFVTDADGARVVNWLEDVTYSSSQVIEFGENLLDFARSTQNENLATVIIPYGAADETTGERVTITSVNDGQDFLQDYDAVALRGVIAKAVYWDDITLPENLLAKAQQYLANNRLVVTSLQLTAVDLSDLDKNIDSFRVGDLIRVRSKPHNVDDLFQLTARTYDFLNPASNTVTLGQATATLTGASASAANQSTTELQRVERNIRAGFTLDAAAVVEEVRSTLTSLIQQTSEEIKLEVSESYATNEELVSAVETTISQLADSIEFTFSSLQQVVDENDAEARAQFALTEQYIRFEDGDIVLGEAGNELVLRIQNDRISFLDDGAEVAYLSNKKLFVVDGHFLQSLRIGSFSWVPRANGNLSLMKVVE